MTIANKPFLVALFASMFLTAALPAATRTAASCNASDVQAAVTAAADGDTINVPAGSCTWTTGVTVPANIGISIIGTGTPNSTSSTVGASSSCTQTSITVSGGITAFRAHPAYGNSTERLSCMVIASGSGSGVAASILGTCTPSGCPNLRMDNITFSNWAAHAILVSLRDHRHR